MINIMMVTGAVLFLFGTITSLANGSPLVPTEIIVEKHVRPEFAEKLSNLGLQPGYPPFISNFMQHGTNVFFKPQFMLSPTYFAPGQGMIVENNEDCKQGPILPAVPFAAPPEIIMEEPVKVVETIVSEAQPPAVDKVIFIKPPAPEIAELPSPPRVIAPLPAVPEEITVDFPVSSPMIFPPVPELPSPVVPVSMDIEPVPIAPELPLLELQQAPVVIDVSGHASISEVHMDEIAQPVLQEIRPVLISDAPELPPLSLPEVVLPSLPAMPAPEPVSVSVVETFDNPMSLNIPEAPELPPYSPPELPLPVILPEVIRECDKQNKTELILESPILMPSHPPIIEDVEPMIMPLPPALPQPSVFSADIVVSEPVLVEDNYKPVAIPAAPELPEFQVPTLPIVMDLPVPEIVAVPEAPLPPSEISEVVVSHEESTLTEEVRPIVPIPNPPILPPMAIPDLPVSIAVSEAISFDAPEVSVLDDTKPLLIEEPIFKPIEIPAPPVLPPMAPITLPEIPAVPAIVHDATVITADASPYFTTFEQEIVSNEIPLIEVPEYAKPVAIPEVHLPEYVKPVAISEVPVIIEHISKPSKIPAAPEFPPLSYPSTSILLEEPMVAMYPPAELTPMIVESNLPHFEVPNKPLFMSFAQPPRVPMSEVESILSFPTSCVKNIVIERVLPNIISERKMEVASLPNYPVLSPHSQTIGIRLY